MKKSKIIIVVLGFIFLLIMSGCNNSEPIPDDQEKAEEAIIETETEAEIETEIETETEIQTDTENEEDWTQFSNIKDLITLIEDCYSYLDDGSDNVEEMSIIGDMITIATIEAPLLDAGLEHAMNGSIDEFDTGILKNFSETGTYQTTLEEEGGVYTYNYQFTSNDQQVSGSKLLFNPKEKMAVSESTDDYGVTTKITYRVSEDKLYVAYGRADSKNNKLDQLLLYYDGIEANYARSIFNELDQELLPIDLSNQQPTNWQELLGDFDYQRTMYYDGNETVFEEIS